MGRRLRRLRRGRRRGRRLQRGGYRFWRRLRRPEGSESRKLGTLRTTGPPIRRKPDGLRGVEWLSPEMEAGESEELEGIREDVLGLWEDVLGLVGRGREPGDRARWLDTPGPEAPRG